jgi:hypothetical protein
VDDPGYVTQKRKQDVQPELRSDAHLQEDAKGRQKNRQQNPDQVHEKSLLVECFSSFAQEWLALFLHGKL